MITTESKTTIKRKARDKKIIDLWLQHYIKGETQITPIAEGISKKVGASLTTVRRVVKHLI